MRSSATAPRAMLPAAGWLFLALLASVAGTQEKPAARVEEELEVREVLLDVLVTGLQGHVIVGLGKEDFVVEENGRPVEIQSVSFYSNRRLLAPGAPAGDAAVPEDRWFVLLFVRPPVGPSRDPLLAARLPKAGRGCVEWVARHLLPSDHVAVATYDGALNLVLDFSVDLEGIEEAVRQAASGKAPRKHWPTRTEIAEGPSLGGLFADDTLRDRTADLRVAMRELAAPLGEIPGRKILILLGAELPAPVSATDRRRHLALVEALNGSNVAVYPLDVTGRGRRPGLDELARATGGGYPFHGRSLTEPLREIERENSGFYLLSYRSARAPGEAVYRRVEVRTTNPELQARSRSGYGGR